MRECTEIAHALLDRFELNLLSPQTNTETDLAQFAWEYALAKMWQAWGITPTAAIATGVGQYAAACIAGVFNLETGLKLLVAQPTPDVSLSKPQLKLVFVENNHLAGIFNEGINRSCTVIPTLEQAISTLKQQEYTVLLATGTGLASRDDILCIPHSFSGDYWQKLLQSVVKLYFQGVKIDWAGFDRAYQRQPVSLPTYPWQRQRYWWQQRNTPNGNGKGISVEHLSAELASSGELSPEEVQLLPKLLNLIEQKLQPHQETSQDDISPQNQELLATIKQRTLSAEDIKTWLSDRIASDLGIAAAAIDPHAPFDSYGIDSVLAIGIASEGKRLLGFDISPIVLVHYPTIDVLSRYLAEEFDKSETEILEI